MFCFPLTNWTTMRGAAGSATTAIITQSESQWLDLQPFEDVVAWLQCQERTLGAATTITLTYQTAPTKDESLFAAAAAAFALTPAAPPVVTKVLMSAASLPLARWLRWQLGITGTATSSWDATFRIWIAANIGPHQLKPRTPSPQLRANGKSCNGDCQNGGSKPKAGFMLPSRDAPAGGNTGANRGRMVQRMPFGMPSASPTTPSAMVPGGRSGPQRTLPQHLTTNPGPPN